MKIFNGICFLCGGLCVVAGVWPLLFNIFHIGNIAIIILGVLFMLLPFILHWTKKKKILFHSVITVYSLGIAFLVFFSSLMVYRAWLTPPPDTGEQTVIVLGAGLVGEYPSRLLAKRLNVAYDYLVSNPEALCIVSGGQGDDEVISEALAMKTYLVRKGLDSDRIIMEDKSTSTRENLRFSQALLPPNSVGTIIVTDAFHQCRAYITANDLGMHPLYSVSARTDWGIFPSYWIRDLFGIPLTWLETKGISFNL